MVDLATQDKWNKAAASIDLMTGYGEQKRWLPFKAGLFNHMQPGRILFAALGTGLDIPAFPPGMTITAIDISPEMLKRAQQRISDYQGEIRAELMDIHEMPYPDGHFDQVFTSCTFCSVGSIAARVETGRATVYVRTHGKPVFPLQIHDGCHDGHYQEDRTRYEQEYRRQRQGCRF